MEIIKDLPEVFEEFAEQRQKSFLMMKGNTSSRSLLYIFPKRDCYGYGSFNSQPVFHI